MDISRVGYSDITQVLVKVVTKDGVREVDFDNDRIARSA